MRISKYIFSLLVMLAFTFVAFGQAREDGMTSKKKANMLYQESRGLARTTRYEDAIKKLDKAIEIDPYFAVAYDEKAQLYRMLKNQEMVIKTYKDMLSTIKPDVKFVKESYYFLASFEQEYGQYDSAVAHYKQFLEFTNVKVSYQEKARQGIETCEFASNAKSNPVPFNPVNLGEHINSSLNEYFPGVTLDGNTFIYTRMLKDGRYVQEDFYISEKKDGKWQQSKNLGEPINTRMNEGTVSVTANGKYIFYTACNRPTGIGKCDLYFSKYENGEWGKPKLLPPPINTAHWESQPSIASDGRTLYFTSGRPGGKGGLDLYVAKLESGGIKKPQNLGDVINTSGNEQTPFIHADGKTLYFVSNGHPGMGGDDIFVTRKDEDGNWSKPENLGYPINDQGDEKGIVVDRTGKMAYLTSDREGGMGGLDIYSFELPETKQATPVSYVKGYVYDIETNKPIRTDIVLNDLKKNKQVLEFKSGKDGNFFIVLESHNDYGLVIDKLGYLFHSENFSLTQTTELKPYELKIGLSKPKSGSSIVLKNVLFDTDKFNLKEQSKLELEKVRQLLEKNPNAKVEIAGHTDNVGSETHNKTLSQNRAKSVVEYLIEKGISKDRLTYKGYGSSKPVASNSTKEGRAQNRRTELVILSL